MNINEHNETHHTAFLSGGGLLAELIKVYDWSKTSLGAFQHWPQSLKTSVSIILRSPVPLVMLWGHEGIMIYNDAYSVFAGARHPFLLGTKVVEGWPEIAEFNRNVMLNVLQGKTLSYKDQQLTLFRNNVAEEVWMDLNYSPVTDESGNPAGVLAIVVETTQRVLAEQKQKNAEDALREREERLQALITATSDVIYTMSADWSEMGILQGKVFVPDIGMARRDWFENNIPATDQNTVRKAINEAINNKSVFQLEHRVKLADGSIGWTFSRAIPIFNSEGEVTEWLGVASDVTERKKVEEALRESEERFRAIADDAPVFIFLAGENAEVDYLNKTWREYTGVSKEDSKGRAWAEITHADDVEPATKIYMEGFNKRESCTFENRQKGTDGIYRTILWKATPRFSPNGQFIGLMGVGLDIHDRKNAEDRLRESEERFRILAEAAPNFIWTLGPDGAVTYMNEFGLKFFDIPLEKLVSWLPLVHPDDVDMAGKLLGEAYRTRTRYQFEHRIKRADGEYVWVISTANPAILSNGELYGYIGSSVDISSRKQMEEALKESETHFRMLADEAPVFIFISDENADVKFWNKTYLEFTGLSFEESLDSSWSKIVHPEDYEPLLSTYLNAIKARAPYSGEWRLKNKNGQYRWILFQGQPRYQTNGEYIGFMGSGSDVHIIKEVENVLKESEERFRTMAEGTEILIATTDELGNVLYFNKAWSDFTGRSMDDLINNGWTDLIHEEDRQAFLDTYFSAFKKRIPFRSEFRIKSKSEEYRWLLGIGPPRFRPDGSFAGYISSSIDITERILAEKELESKNTQLTLTNNDLDNFIYTASHDLKAPISNIEALLDALLRTLPPESLNSDRTLSITDRMHVSVERFKKTIANLTEVVKLQKENSGEAVQVNLSEVVKEIRLDLEQDIQSSGAILEVNLADCSTIKFSEKNLRSVVYNLVSNAIKYRAPDRVPHVKINCNSTSDYIVLSVKDNGLGIDSKKTDQLFTMFKRFHTHVEGTGIGLYMVKKMVENAGGRIEVESQLGEGTTFHVYFKR